MREYALRQAYQIHGEQLVAQVQAAHGVDISGQYSFVEPASVEVHGFDEVDLSATIAAHVPAAAVPAKVSTWRLRAVVELHGLSASISAAIDALPEPARTIARSGWEYSFEMDRDTGLVSQLGAALGMTPAEVDALFLEAVALAV
jgi:hypothetical protein